jgi:hypothetical protein
VAAFTALVVFHGMLVAVLAGRVSRAVPLLDAQPQAVAAHAPLLLLLLLGPVVVVLAIVGAAAAVASRLPAVVAVWHDRRVVTIGRVALTLVAVVAFPGFASGILDIFGQP